MTRPQRPPTPTAVGLRISQERRDRKWTQGELASRAGVDPSYVNKVESGRIQAPSGETLDKIAAALGWSSDDLLRGKPTPLDADDALLRRMIESRVGNRASADLIAVLIEKSRGRAPADVETIVSVVDVLLGKPPTDR